MFAVVLAVGAIALAAPAGAVTKTVMDRIGGSPSYATNHTIRIASEFKPARPVGTRVHIQRHTASGWVAYGSTKTFHNATTSHGTYSFYRWSKSGVAYAIYTLRACVPATSRATAACSKPATFWVGRWHSMANTPPTGVSDGYSYGSIELQGLPSPGYDRWTSTTMDGWVTLDLQGKCDTGEITIAVGDDTDENNMIGRVTFTAYANGVLWKSYSLGPSSDASVYDINMHGIHVLKLEGMPQSPGGAGQYYGFSAGTFCLF